MYESKFWMIWRANITPTTCLYCASMNGRILSTTDPAINTIPVHPNCNCFVEALIENEEVEVTIKYSKDDGDDISDFMV